MTKKRGPKNVIFYFALYIYRKKDETKDFEPYI